MTFPIKPLGDVLETDFDGTWGDSTDQANSGIKVIRSTDMRGGIINYDTPELRAISSSVLRKKKLRSGDILVNKASGSAHLVGLSALFQTDSTESFLCSNFVRCLRPDKELIDPEFLHFATQSKDFRSQIFGAQRTTSGLRNLKISGYKSARIPVPTLLEQRRIVTRIKECLARVEEVENLRKDGTKECAALTRSYLSEIYRNTLQCFPPEELGCLGVVNGGGTPSKQNADFWNGSIPWISPKDMKKNVLSEAFLNISQSAIEGSSAKLIPSHSVLFVVRGMILIHTLPVAVNTVPAAINQDMKAITPRSGIIADFLAAMIRGAEQQLLSRVEVAGHGTRRLQTQHWASLAIPVPPVVEQEKIVEEISVFENSISQIQRDVAGQDCALLRDAILRKAFAGEL